MAEYIEREAAIDRLEKLFQLQAATARAIIEAIPAADVVPVRHGRWIFKADSSWSGGGKYECSACKYGYAIGSYHEPDEFTYCPHCGAYMKDGGKE